MRLALLTVLVLAAAPAAAYTTRLGERVEARGEGQFEVLASAGQGAAASWCAAGDYVLHRLGLPPETRIWRLSAPPRAAGQGVTFGLSAAGAQGSGLFNFGFKPGAETGLTAAFAENLCFGLGPMRADPES
ncbi:MAG: hypothetical protein JNJ84_06980 [Rhodobacteraceae bacterium]|nr:hypothetical protein [Paracoccaceae bacterium]